MRIDRTGGADSPDQPEPDREQSAREYKPPEVKGADPAKARWAHRERLLRHVEAAYANGEIDEQGRPTDSQKESTEDTSDKADEKPEDQRSFRTLTDEFGEQRSWSSFGAARRDSIKTHGDRPGQDLHHITEQCQAKPERSGFPVEQINTSDNMTWIDKDVHTRVSARYSRSVPGLPGQLRDTLDGTSWEHQHKRGSEILDQEIRRRPDGDD